MENIININEIVRPQRVSQINQADEYNKSEIGICSVPIQEWEQIYDEDTAFSAGTLFPSLNKQFYGSMSEEVYNKYGQK